MSETNPHEFVASNELQQFTPISEKLRSFNHPNSREALRNALEQTGTEFQRVIGVNNPENDAIAVAMGVILRGRLLTNVPDEDVHHKYRVRAREYDGRDRVCEFLLKFDSSQDLVEAFSVEYVKDEFRSLLEQAGTQYQKEHGVKYEVLQPLEIGYIQKSSRVIFWNPEM